MILFLGGLLSPSIVYGLRPDLGDRLRYLYSSNHARPLYTENSSQISSQFPEFICIVQDQTNHNNHLDLFKLKMVQFAFEINTYTFENGTYWSTRVNTLRNLYLVKHHMHNDQWNKRVDYWVIFHFAYIRRKSMLKYSIFGFSA